MSSMQPPDRTPRQQVKDLLMATPLSLRQLAKIVGITLSPPLAREERCKPWGVRSLILLCLHPSAMSRFEPSSLFTCRANRDAAVQRFKIRGGRLRVKS
jgi:hypothetical protein